MQIKWTLYINFDLLHTALCESDIYIGLCENWKISITSHLLIKTHVLYPPFIIFISSIWEMIYLLLFKVIQSMILMEKKRIIGLNVLQSLEVNKILPSFTFVKKLYVHSNFLNFFIIFFFFERVHYFNSFFMYVTYIIILFCFFHI